MKKDERDEIHLKMSQEARDCYREIMVRLRSEMKSIPGHRTSVKELLESGKIKVPVDVHDAVEEVMERDETGPKVGDPAVDFTLKRLRSEERVRLAGFRGKRPVALLFGSYT